MSHKVPSFLKPVTNPAEIAAVREQVRTGRLDETPIWVDELSVDACLSEEEPWLELPKHN